ncbi:hypothetical protein NPA08_00175 [Mycoplasmopsis citelli]|uniref:hypothetical protein n=1 Tax=Mycoplasmopsis citelli TaxID=171281 RepID=UPI00211464CC|nr:hypothetical protein [Mycoplasmopsis citelli]UUD36246.1 hypothetical protein NPA08_00175 [Mycoplasmopsis citelli]
MKKFRIKWLNRFNMNSKEIDSFSLIKNVDKNLLFYAKKEPQGINYWIDNFLWDRFSRKVLKILSYDSSIKTFNKITDILDEKSDYFKQQWKEYISIKQLKNEINLDFNNNNNRDNLNQKLVE